MKKLTQKQLYYSPLLLSLIFSSLIIILGILSADYSGDTFSEDIKQAIIKSGPGLAILMITYYSWKHKKVGGIIFIIFGLIFTYSSWNQAPKWIIPIFALPLITIGYLFIKTKNQKNPGNEPRS